MKNNSRRRAPTWIHALVFACVLIPAWASAQPVYRLTDLGTLGGSQSMGIDLNESGYVTGYSRTVEEHIHAFLWDGISIQDLGTLGGSVSYGIAINSSGQVTGHSAGPPSGESDSQVHAFLWDGSYMQDLGTLPGGTSSSGLAINDSGWVTGRAETEDAGDFGSHAFLWNGTDLLDLGTLPYFSDSAGHAINASGWVTGESSGSGGAAVIWAGTSMTRIGTFKGRNSEGRDINDSGWVTGCAQRDEDYDTRPFLWNGVTLTQFLALGDSSCGIAINESGWVIGDSDTGYGIRGWAWNGTLIPLGTLSGFEETSPQDINDFGFVTGSATNPTNIFDNRAFVWDGALIHDLNQLVDPADPLRQFVTLKFGQRINNRGQILANGTDSRTGHVHAYLATPQEVDADGDGIAASIDTDPSNASSAFNDSNGTSGLIADRGGLTLEIEDADSPLGVRVTAGAGTGSATIEACGFTFMLDPDSELLVTCGSLILEVIQGEAQVILNGILTVISVAAGASATVTDNGDGTFGVENTGSTGEVMVTIDGIQTTIAPGDSQSYLVTYQFKGFFSPVDNVPTLNFAKSGTAIPVKFSLSGDQGMSIFSDGYPKSQKISCSTSAPLDAVEETVIAGASSLSYAADVDQYSYVWKSDKSWAGTCRKLILKLSDASEHEATFKFK